MSKHIVNPELMKKFKETSDVVMGKLNKQEQNSVVDLMESFILYRSGKLTNTELDEKLLFTPKKIKDSAYTLDEVVQSHHNKSGIRAEFEVITDKKEIKKIHDK